MQVVAVEVDIIIHLLQVVQVPEEVAEVELEPQQ
jgi:hypothetical protein